MNRSDPTGTIIRFPAPWGDYGPEQEGLITANSAVKQMVVNEMIRSPLIFTFNSVAAINALFEKRDRLARYHNLAMGLDESTPYLDGAIEGTQIVPKTAIVVGAVAATGGLAVSAGAAYAAGGATGLVVFGAETAVTVKAAGLVNEGAQEGLRAAGVAEDFIAPVADVVTAGVMALPVKRLLTPKKNSPAAPSRSRSPMEPAEEGGNLNDYGKPSAPSQTKQGGAYGDIPANGGEVHHMPANSVSPLSKNAGPAVRMSKSDHSETASWGSSTEARAYRAKQQSLIDQGKFMQAQQMDIEDLKSLFGTKYDTRVQQMLDYTKTIDPDLLKPN